MNELRHYINTKRFFDALVTVYGSALEDYLKSWIDSHKEFGANTIGALDHRFDETIEYLLWSDGNLLVLARHFGARESKQILTQLNPYCKTDYITVEDLEEAIRQELSIPTLCVNGRNYFKNKLINLIAGYDSNPKGTACESRPFFERLLREVSLAAAGTYLGNTMIDVLKKNDWIKLPPDWGRRAELDIPTLKSYLQNISHKVDLGFFIILLEETSKIAITCNLTQFRPFMGEDSARFRKISEALNNTLHDRPNCCSDELKIALIGINEVVVAMAERRAIPNAAVLIESTESIFGRRYSGRSESGEKITIRSDDDIPLGKRILFTEVCNPVHRLDGWVEVDW